MLAIELRGKIKSKQRALGKLEVVCNIRSGIEGISWIEINAFKVLILKNFSITNKLSRF